MGSAPEDESTEEMMGLTERLLDFSPNVSDLSEEQEETLKKATLYFYRQLLLKQQRKVVSKVSSCGSDICRICRETESKEHLYTPCSCRGTMRFIHLSCLERWLAESDTTRCELCSFQYQTVRTPKFFSRYSVIKSILLWLSNPGRRRDSREMLLDTLAFIVFTPVALLGTYLALMIAEAWYKTEDAVLARPMLTRFTTLGCVGIIGAMDTAYLSWVMLRTQHHARAWRRWWRRHSTVKVILPAAEPSKSQSEPSEHTDEEEGEEEVETNTDFQIET